MKQPMRVMGVRRFKGDVEGNHHDFTKLRMEMPVPRNAANEIGAAEVTVNYGTADKFDELKGLKFPGLFLCDVEMSSKGLDCFSVEPMPAGAKA